MSSSNLPDPVKGLADLISHLREWAAFYEEGRRNAVRRIELLRLRFDQLGADDEFGFQCGLMLQRVRCAADAYEFVAGQLQDLVSVAHARYGSDELARDPETARRRMKAVLELLQAIIVEFLESEIQHLTLMDRAGLQEAATRQFDEELARRVSACTRAQSSQTVVTMRHARNSLSEVVAVFASLFALKELD